MAAPARTFGLAKMYPQKTTKGSKVTTVVDIVTIHGLDTSSERTWSAYEKEGDPSSRLVNWLGDEDVLPHFFPDARIFAYNWNANTFSDASTHYFHNHAEELLQKLENVRQTRKNHPIIFAASCYGGLIVAKALLLASTGHSEYKHLLDATIGIIFLGTPFRGSDGTSAAQTRVNVAKMIGHVASKTLLSVLDEQSGALDEIRHEFVRLLRSPRDPELRIVCYYETKPTPIYKAIFTERIANKLSEVVLVDMSSACLDGWDRKPLHVNHPMLNKFRSPKDGNYKDVAGEIHKLVEKVREKNTVSEPPKNPENMPRRKSRTTSRNEEPESGKTQANELQSNQTPKTTDKGESGDEENDQDGYETAQEGVQVSVESEVSKSKGKPKETKPDSPKSDTEASDQKSALPIAKETSKTKSKGKALNVEQGSVVTSLPYHASSSSDIYSYDSMRKGKRADKRRTRREKRRDPTVESDCSIAFNAVFSDYSHYQSSSQRNPVPSSSYPAPYDSSVRSSSPDPSQYHMGSNYPTADCDTPPPNLSHRESSGSVNFAGLVSGFVGGAASGALIYAGSSFRGSGNTGSRPTRTEQERRTYLLTGNSNDTQEGEHNGGHSDVTKYPTYGKSREQDPIQKPTDEDNDSQPISKYPIYDKNRTQDPMQKPTNGESDSRPIYRPTTECIPRDSKQTSVTMRAITIRDTDDNGLRELKDIDRRYQVMQPKAWGVGLIFLILWTDPKGRSATSVPHSEDETYDSDGSRVYIRRTPPRAFYTIRSFVVIVDGYGHTCCCPIKTYGGQATLKHGVDPRSHAMIFTSKQSPSEQRYTSDDGETITENLKLPSIKVKPKEKDQDCKLHAASRINFGKLYTVEKNVRVRVIGSVSKDSMQDFLSCAKQAFKTGGGEYQEHRGKESTDSMTQDHTTQNYYTGQNYTIQNYTTQDYTTEMHGRVVYAPEGYAPGNYTAQGPTAQPAATNTTLDENAKVVPADEDT